MLDDTLVIIIYNDFITFRMYLMINSHDSKLNLTVP